MKRFTETEKWNDPWFRRLKPHIKLFWQFICDVCDNAGVWQPDFEMASFQIGQEIKEEEVKEALGDRIRILDNGKWWVAKFIFFQQKILYKDKPAHKNILSLCHRHGIDMPSGKGKGNSTGTGKCNGQISAEDFIRKLKDNPAYKHVDIDRELSKMDAWLLAHPGREKTTRFAVNWLNKIQAPLPSTKQSFIPPKPGDFSRSQTEGGF